MKPYQKGYQAGRAKRNPVDVSANPYKHFTTNWIEWNKGWNAAWHGRKEREIRQISRDEWGYRRSVIDEVRQWQCEHFDPDAEDFY